MEWPSRCWGAGDAAGARILRSQTGCPSSDGGALDTLRSGSAVVVPSEEEGRLVGPCRAWRTDALAVRRGDHPGAEGMRAAEHQATSGAATAKRIVV